MLTVFVKVVEVFLGEAIACLVRLQSLIGLRQPLKLGLVASCLHVGVVHFRELQIHFAQFSLCQLLAQALSLVLALDHHLQPLCLVIEDALCL